MKHFALSLLAAASLLPLHAEDDKIDLPPLEGVPHFELQFKDAEDYDAAFSNMPKAKKQLFGKALFDAQNFLQRKRIFSALDSLHEAEKILPGAPNTCNLFGACFVEFRDFAKAEKYFGTVYKMAPANIPVLFNLAEISFVRHDWDTSLTRFNHLLLQMKEQESTMVDLARFKKLISLLKLDRVDEAKEVQKLYDADDDTPFYHYARAAVAFQSSDEVEGMRALTSGRRIYGAAGAGGAGIAINASWEDTMIEAGYVDSFFGGIAEDADE